MKRLNQILIFLCLPLTQLTTSIAQDTGQICVMSYEDRNGNGSLDADEPPVTQGIAVNLQSALGITVATKSLEASSYAVPGLLCLEDIPRGEYQLLLTSAQYRATTDVMLSAAVAPGSAPVRHDFGVTSLLVPAAADSPGSTIQMTDEQMQGLRGMGIGLIASILISSVMLLIGWLIYMLVFHPRLERMRAQQPPDPPAGATTRQMGMALSSTALQTMSTPSQSSLSRFSDDDSSSDPGT